MDEKEEVMRIGSGQLAGAVLLLLALGAGMPASGRTIQWFCDSGGAKQFSDGRAWLTFALYHLERNNIAIPDSTGVRRQVGDQSPAQATCSARYDRYVWFHPATIVARRRCGA